MSATVSVTVSVAVFGVAEHMATTEAMLRNTATFGARDFSRRRGAS